MNTTIAQQIANEGGVEAYLHAQQHKSLLRFLTCGSVDDGKSTLIGRLLHDTRQIYEDQLSSLHNDSKRHGTQGEKLDLALLVDGLQAEREQGITIDVAYRYFSTEKRKFIIADTPGHEQYTRNMATGASTCDLAILLIDARKGVLDQTRRHSFISTLLGIKQVYPGRYLPGSLLQFFLPVHRRTGPVGRRTGVQRHQLCGGQMHAVQPGHRRRGTGQQHAAAAAGGQRPDFVRQLHAVGFDPAGLPHDYQRKGGRVGANALEDGGSSGFTGTGQRQRGRQGQCPEYRRVGRQHRSDIQGAGCRLPRPVLAFARLRLPLPAGHPPERQPHAGVFVVKMLGQPRSGFFDGQTQLFVKLAYQRLVRCFAGFQLAAGEFPVTGIRLALRPARQKKVAVRGQQHPGDDIHPFGHDACCFVSP